MKKDPAPGQPSLHPRNLHQGFYDFEVLMQAYPPLSNYVSPNPRGQLSIDFGIAEAVFALNKALLKAQYEVQEWSIPAGYLCPPVPGRADYMHHAADLLASSNAGVIPKGPRVHCLDIGTGANIIYPIVGIRSYDWQFTGTEVDEQALASAKKIQEANPFLQQSLTLKKQANPAFIFKNMIEESAYVDLVCCNPPFYESAQKAEQATLRKQRNLKQTLDPQRRNFGGQDHELWYPGGEIAFIQKMIRESVAFAKNVCWFTSLVARENHLSPLYQELEHANSVETRTIDMGQGNKRSRLLAWTFLNPKQHKAWSQYRWQSKTNH